MFKRIINITLWTIIGLYVAVIILLHIPAVQSFVGGCTADALCKKFGTKVSVGRVDLGFINRLIIDDSEMLDQQGKQMLKVSRISVKINLLALANGEIEVTSAQFFGLRANLYKATATAKPNYQFVVDSLASNDTTKQKTPLNLQINSLIIRRGEVRYRCLSRIDGRQQFSTDDILARDISAHIIVNRITDDSVNVKVKRIALNERCGLRLKSLSLRAVAERHGAEIKDFRMEMPNTLIEIPRLTATYRMKGKSIEMPTLQFDGSVDIPRIAPADFGGLLPKLWHMDGRYALHTDFYGTGSGITIKRLTASSADNTLRINVNGGVRNYPARTSWYANITELKANSNGTAPIFKALAGKPLPDVVERLGNISIKGYAGGDKRSVAAYGEIRTAVGSVKLAADKKGDNITGHVETHALDIGRLAGDSHVGHISAVINAKGTSKDNVAVNGRLFDIEYNGYAYRNVDIDAKYHKKKMEGKIGINDPNVQIDVDGLLDMAARVPSAKIAANVRHIVPNALHLTHKWPETAFAANITADIKGNGLNNADGSVEISSFRMNGPGKDFGMERLLARTGYNGGNHFLNIDSDFGQIDINGHFSYESIASSINNLIASKLPTIPGMGRKPQADYNDFTLNANINSTLWMREMLGVPLDLQQPLNISMAMDDRRHKLDMWCDLPAFAYNDEEYHNAYICMQTPGDTLRADVRIKKIMDNGKTMSLLLNAGACDNRLKTSLKFSNNERHPLKGEINASSVFAKNEHGVPTAYVDVLESRATIGDTVWNVAPARIEYSKNRLNVDGFSISHGNQYININGTATKSTEDSLMVDLNDVDVSYILNLVNFHSVDFFGMASGQAHIAGAFSGKPQMAADLRVKDFKFETGRMGTLFAHVDYNDTEGRIEIDATAHDEGQRRTYINGYVSPKHNYIDLGIKARQSRAEFMESFCGSFMDNVDASIEGDLNVVGPLNNINLVGQAVVNGSVHLTALNTTYWMKNDTVRFVPDEIKFYGDTLRDRNGNIGVMEGSVYHKHLTNLSYDLGIKAHNLLAYDTHSFGDNTFYGTAYATGDCRIKGKSGEVTIDIDVVPQKNSIIVYNASDRNSVGSQDFITWHNHNATDSLDNDNGDSARPELSTNIFLNFIVNCTPDATIKLIMDDKTGDYITLNGDGALRASYFNKGSFDIYGNYIVDHGLYKLTIQNVIKKDFAFQKGGMITFGGNPYDATLDLKAQYVLNSVSLADLNIGSSFSNNNVRVNCIMNITGNPNTPKVDFDLDMPSLSNDAKQMVYSLLNAEEEKNQQVLYLLAVGRFYAMSSNNQMGSQQYSQTSLAMQSFLSGTISQQINNVLSNVINSRNWDFGANISTGTEGFNNAEYEGLLSGRLLNNRLLINGQFGYRDNANATTSFIGDFDLKYLLVPNGNLAINVYNKTNDRYFTRNSMNTQGIGVIMKKDFTRFSDLFFWRKRSKKK